MHLIEPHYNWRNYYIAEDDPNSPFYGREYSEFMFTERIYDHYIHPQWDNIGSTTLFLKILYCNYEDGFAIIEFIGEWNDCLYNDIMTLKRDIIDELIHLGINKFILIVENVLNFHSSDDCYYEEWFDDLEDDGWIALINPREHVLTEFIDTNIDQYFVLGGKLNVVNWRTYQPMQLCISINKSVQNRLTY